MMTFENEETKRREKKAISVFTNMFGGSYQKLDQLDIDYKVFDKSGSLIAYAEVVSRFKSVRDPYPLYITARKLMKLIDKRLPPVIIWCCDDGIIYGKANKLIGEIRWGSDTPPDDELFVFYNKQPEFKYIRFI